MKVFNYKKIEEILNKYMWDLVGYPTNIKIYDDLIKEVPELESININLYKNINITEWYNYIIKADTLRKVKFRNKIIDSIINE